MKSIIYVLLGLLPVLVATSASGAEAAVKKSTRFHHHEVNKRTSELPQQEDFSTPESAYVAINRLMAEGGDWDRVHYQKMTHPLREAPSEEASKKWKDVLLREIWTYSHEDYPIQIARVLAEVKDGPGVVKYDQRSLVYINQGWRNVGHDGSISSIEDAREKFKEKAQRLLEHISINLAKDTPLPIREKIDNPTAHLETFTDFLNRKGNEPKEFIIGALKNYSVTILSEVHHRPVYWAFNSSLVQDPRFAENIKVIYMELPQNNQPLIDEFLHKKQLDKELVIETLRDFFEMGWPDQAMLDFFVAVWKVNQNLPQEKRIRIELVDMQRPWAKIQKKSDWREYNVDRDEFMAENIKADLEEHSNDSRNALFIVGVAHAMMNLKKVDGITPYRSAGWHLNQRLPNGSVYSIFPHKPSQTNMGSVKGRLCLGLFDNAFEKLGHQPIAFPLNTGPFGKQWFDAMPDKRAANTSTYADGYSAYLFLVPLEEETFSPLIPGFYTNEFVQEIDRRYRLMRGKSWHEIYGQDRTDPELFTKWMSSSWGQPRKWRYSLGPIDAWIVGDIWYENHRKNTLEKARSQPSNMILAANELFKIIQKAPYNKLNSGREMLRYLKSEFKKPNSKVTYTTSCFWDFWAKWQYDHFKDNPIVSVKIGDVVESEISSSKMGTVSLPALNYCLTLKNGEVLEGVLPFDYNPLNNQWDAMMGLDWHLKDKGRCKKAN